MTIHEYREKFGEEFQAASRYAWFSAFLQTLKDQHPMKRLRTRVEGDKLHGATMLLAQIDGYEECLSNIDELLAREVPETQEQASEYTEEEIPVT